MRGVGVAAVGILLLVGGCGSDDVGDGGSGKEQAASACDDYIALLRDTQAGDLSLSDAIDGVRDAGAKAADAASDDAQWEPLVDALDRIEAILRSGDQSDFPSASRALQTTCADAFDIEAP
jgi:hypothetical protein